MTDGEARYIDVVVGIIAQSKAPSAMVEWDVLSNPSVEFLIAERTNGPYAGLWEFPGGKVEIGETQFEALCRELKEEVGLLVQDAQPLVQICTAAVKPGFRLRLFVWKVTRFTGQASGVEGQAVRWTSLQWGDQSHFLPANRHMFTALRLRPYFIFVDLDQCKSICEALEKIKQYDLLPHKSKLMVRLRANGLEAYRYYEFLHIIIERFGESQLQFCVDVLPASCFYTTTFWVKKCVLAAYFPSWWRERDHQEISDVLTYLNARQPHLLRGASCHNVDELNWSCENLSGPLAHFYCLSPVAPTSSHPGQKHVGWSQWSTLNQIQPQPGFALGGVGVSDSDTAQEKGAFGVAGKSGFKYSDLEFS